jgi:hypothetical protein
MATGPTNPPAIHHWRHHWVAHTANRGRPVAWQFSARDHTRREARERAALRVTAVSFFALATFVTIESLRALLGSGRAEHSTVGIVLAAVSLALMPALSYAQRRAGRQLGSGSAVADSKQTLLCTYLSAVLLVGLLANSTLGWDWADPIAGIAIVGIAIREGIQTWRGEGCCALPAGNTNDCAPDCTCC